MKETEDCISWCKLLCTSVGGFINNVHKCEISYSITRACLIVGENESVILMILLSQTALLWPKFVVERSALLFRIPEPRHQISTRRPVVLTEIFVVFLSSLGQMTGKHLNIVTNAHVHVLPHPLFTNHPIIIRCKILAIESSIKWIEHIISALLC
jgi:hypothetical protein